MTAKPDDLADPAPLAGVLAFPLTELAIDEGLSSMRLRLQEPSVCRCFELEAPL